MKIRQGRKVGRTIYLQEGPEPSDDDPLIGCVDTPEFGALVVEAVNAWLQGGDGSSRVPQFRHLNRALMQAGGDLDG